MNSKLRKALAVTQVVGGLSGIADLLSVLSRRQLDSTGVVLACVALCLFSVSLAAGVLLWCDTKAGWWASVVVQLTQLPKFVSPTFAWMMSYGFDVWVIAVSTRGGTGYGLRLDARFGHVSALRVGDDTLPVALGVSVLSCLALVALSGRTRPADDEPTALPGDTNAVEQFRRTQDAIRRAKNA